MDLIAALLFSFMAAFALLWTPFAWLACAIFSWVVAREKQYSGFAWFLLGILFGPVALIATAGLPNRSAPHREHPGYPKIEPGISAT